MSGKVVGWAFDVGRECDLSPTQRYVLVAYADNASDKDGKCWPDKPEIVEKTGLSRATVYRAIGALETAGHLRFTEDEKERECVYLSVPWASHSETAESQPEKAQSHSETGTNKEPSDEPSENQQQGAVKRLFEVWKSETGRTSARLTAGRRKAIEARLAEGYDEELIRRAIQNVARSPFHQGQNDRGRRYDGLTLICRSGEKLEGYAELAVPARRPNLHAVESPAPDAEIIAAGLPELEAAWERAVPRLRKSLKGSTFALWVAPLSPVGMNGSVVYLAAPEGIKSWGQRRYAALISEALCPDLGEVEVRLIEASEGEAAA